MAKLKPYQNEKGHFKKGSVPNPMGRPKGSLSGRAQALGILDRILSKPDNQRVMEEKLEKRLRKDPVWFFRALVMPLVPKETIMKMEQSEKAPVRIIFQTEKD